MKQEKAFADNVINTTQALIIGLDADASRYFAQLVHRGRMASEPGRNGVRIAAC